MNKKTLAKIAFSVAALAPAFAYAATIQGILGTVSAILSQIIPILMILATVVFLWGVITYITAGGDEEKAKAGRGYIIWGLIGLFAMVAIWGLVLALVSTFQVGNTGIPSSIGQI
ncbi:MAG: hypothetical protein Q8P07_05850 [bacterium]|nr:hypothetical protein [bacterium]